jgi:hypothetical protein
MLEKFRERAWRELAEMKQARVGLVFVAVAAFSSGFWAAGEFYNRELANRASEIDLLSRQKEAVEKALAERPANQQIFLEWGGGDGSPCHIEVDGLALREFANDYHIVMVCGVSRDGVDRLTDTAISVSAPFTIDSGAIKVVAPLGDEFAKLVVSIADAAKAQPRPPNTMTTLTFQFWYELVLLPKKVDPARAIKSLSDIEPIGGKRHGRAGAAAVRNFRS